MNHIDKLADELTKDVIMHLRSWMKLSNAEDIKFHFFRLRLLSGLGTESRPTQMLLSLCDRVTTKLSFEVAQVTSDKIMGDSVAKYIFGKIIFELNNHYLKILELEEDKIKAENNVVANKMLHLKSKIAQH